MSTYDPNNRPRMRSADSGGGWIIGIIVGVLIGLGIWWWAGTTASGPHTATTNAPPATTTGSAPTSSNPAPAPTTPPARPGGAAK
jgi:cytoskeletal protein RodZ